jgi:hypothetical protein
MPRQEYYCEKCQQWYRKQQPDKYGATTACMVLHAPGSCCHYLETKIDEPPMTPKPVYLAKRAYRCNDCHSESWHSLGLDMLRYIAAIWHDLKAWRASGMHGEEQDSLFRFLAAHEGHNVVILDEKANECGVVFRREESKVVEPHEEWKRARWNGEEWVEVSAEQGQAIESPAIQGPVIATDTEAQRQLLDFVLGREIISVRFSDDDSGEFDLILDDGRELELYALRNRLAWASVTEEESYERDCQEWKAEQEKAPSNPEPAALASWLCDRCQRMNAPTNKQCDCSVNGDGNVTWPGKDNRQPLPFKTVKSKTDDLEWVGESSREFPSYWYQGTCTCAITGVAGCPLHAPSVVKVRMGTSTNPSTNPSSE